MKRKRKKINPAYKNVYLAQSTGHPAVHCKKSVNMLLVVQILLVVQMTVKFIQMLLVVQMTVKF